MGSIASASWANYRLLESIVGCPISVLVMAQGCRTSALRVLYVGEYNRNEPDLGKLFPCIAPHNWSVSRSTMRDLSPKSRGDNEGCIVGDFPIANKCSPLKIGWFQVPFVSDVLYRRSSGCVDVYFQLKRNFISVSHGF